MTHTTMNESLPMLSEHSQTTPADLAAYVTGCLRTILARRGHAFLAVSGGKSPIPVFEALSQQTLNWPKVTITLVDERVVPHDHADSNTALVRQHLLKGEAAKARFVPYFDTTPAEITSRSLAALTIATNERLASLPWPLDLALLGMGEDAHTASLFPDAPGLEEALTSTLPVACVEPTSAPHPRLSLTLASIIAARELVLSISGERKRQVYEAASVHADPAKPVSLVLCQSQTPISVWMD
ncbi:6-phosphogluconolactonase [Hydrogenophaga sp. 5NK40-0174]|uniref:6-phosphogluconolactonase n=1 Tax=Hydrogenophaga sp. 5NK40-0174 TaxID=3127649 RepID=UPI003108CD90